MEESKKSYGMLVASMLIFGTIGIFRRYIPLSSPMLACIRGFMGGLFLLCVLKLQKKKSNFAFSKKQLILLFVTGIALGSNWMLLFEAYNYTSVAVATLCYYMEPTIVILLSPLLFGERLNGKKLISVIVSLIGIALVSGITGKETVGAGDLKGILFGLGAAALYSTVVILNKKNPVEDAYAKTIIQLLSAGIVMVPYIFLTEDFSGIHLGPMAFGMIIVVGIVHTGIAYALYFAALSHVKSQTVAILSYIDPVSAVFLSWLFLHEALSLPVLLGAVMIIGAALVSELNN